MTVKQAAQVAAVSESLVYAWCKDGVLRHARLGRRGKRGTIRIREADLDEFLNALKVDAARRQDGEEGLRHVR